jgi:signal transduction histidine kinase
LRARREDAVVTDPAGTPLLTVALRVERDIFLVRQRGREVAAAVGLEYQDQVRVATALSEVGRELLAAEGADVTFAVTAAPVQRLTVEMISLAPVPGDGRNGERTAAVGRLVDEFTIELGAGGTTVRLSRRLPASAAPLTPQRLDELRSELRELTAATPLDELAAQNNQLLTALDEVRRQRNDLIRLNQELQETNNGVLALYSELSGELEETNRGVVALYAELDDKTAQLHAASEAKSRFLANVSHELRAPVAAVIGLSRLLADSASDPLTGEQATQVELIRTAATDLLHLVNDLLNLAKAEAGRLEPTWVDVDLLAVFTQLRGMLRPLTDADVELIVEDPPPGGTVRSDEVLLTQVLRNLLTNGLKFTERGEVRLRADRPAGSDLVEIVVSDTGIGIPEELHERIFEEFYQVPGPTQARVAGTGLGLPYARRLAHLLGGSLRVASVPGEGSVFTVTLPVRPSLPPTGESGSAG